jgi:hypothetical protein
MKGHRLHVVKGMGLLVAAFAFAFAAPWWTTHLGAREPCLPTMKVQYTGTALEVRQDEAVLPASHPIHRVIPEVLCIEPVADQASGVVVKDCYQGTPHGIFEPTATP